MKELDLYTYGNSKAAVHLTHKLNEIGSKTLNRNVSRFLIQRHRLTQALEEMHDRSARLTFAVMLVNEINSVNIASAPEIVNSLAKNVAIGAIKSKILCAEEYGDDYSFSDVEMDFDF